MTERRTIGQILTALGRITEEDVNKALEYQRDHGGYFGEALLACGFVSHEELEFGLASQFDLPYVFPDADAIDPEAVALVSAEWALGHMALPIMKTSETLTVVVDTPMKAQALEELQARTDLHIDLALASPANIREIIRRVYARGVAAEEGITSSPIHLMNAFGQALETGAVRFGISSRGHRSWAWWDDQGKIRRRPLEGLWEAELERLLKPPPAEQVEGQTRAQWSAELSREGMVTPVEVRYLADESGHEYLFRPVHAQALLHERFPPPVEGIVSEIRLLARSGAARFVVTAEPEELGHEILPHLPHLLLDPSWRSIYINARETEAAEEAFSAHMPPDPDAWASELATLREFHFDAVTVDLTGNQESWAESALDVAAVAFLLWPNDEDRSAAHDAGVRWELHIVRDAGGHLEWSLEHLRA